jgi:hypothetical protein
MTINLVEICRLKYPGQIESGNISFRQPDNAILIGYWNVPNIPQPLESDLLAEASTYQAIYDMNTLQQECLSQIQTIIDSTAQAKQYNDGVSCASYVMSTNDTWKAQATAFIAWRDSVFAYALNILAQVQQGAPLPTVESVIAGLPTMTWPN